MPKLPKGFNAFNARGESIMVDPDRLQGQIFGRHTHSVYETSRDFQSLLKTPQHLSCLLDVHSVESPRQDYTDLLVTR